MSSWIFLAILAYALWAITNILDKIVVSKYVKDYFSLSLLCLLFGSFFILIYALITNGIHPISQKILYLALTAGFARVLGYYFYYKAISYEEASRVTILTQLASIFTLLLSVLFINETLNTNQYFAFAFLLFGGILSSVKFNQKIVKISFAFWDMILFAIFMAINAVMTKYVFQFENFWQCMIWIVTGEIISVILISLLFKKQILKTFFKTLSCGKILILLDQVFSSSALIIWSLALTLGSVSLIGALSSANPIFVFIFAILMGILFPKILKEKIDKNTLLLKITSIILVVIGVYLISV